MRNLFQRAKARLRAQTRFQTKARRLSAILAVAVASVPELAFADFDCLATSRGGTVTWSDGWQGDQQDEGMPYRVASVVDHQDRSGRFVTLELVALGKAQRSVRYLDVTTQTVAKAVCSVLSSASKRDRPEETLVVKNNRVTRVPNIENVISSAPIDPRLAEEPDYPFIKFTAKGWVLSDPPPYEAMTLCEVLGRRFRCLQHDKADHGGALRAVEVEANAIPR